MKKNHFFIKTIFLAVLCVLFFACKTEEPAQLRVIHWCDPQIGIPYVDFQTNVVQTERAVQQINALEPDLVILGGDMVHYPENDEHIKLFLKIIKDIKAPLMITPGNHDIVAAPPVGNNFGALTTEGLQRYRSFFGNDFQTKTKKGYAFISINSSLWSPVGAPQEEIDQHNAKLEKALEKAKKEKHTIVAISHYSPLIEKIPKEYKNIILKYKPVVWLSGHHHRGQKDVVGATTFLIGESTSVCGGGLGFRLLTFYKDKTFDWEFVPLYDLESSETQ